MSKKVKKIVRKIAALGISTIMLVGSTFSATPISSLCRNMNSGVRNVGAGARRTD